ncbi:murein biosynthesis integral membrane protein MurJ [Candidatus Amesbacteria bacterium]|nr:murein biosynthesis integral membrane protein MurJ [Candidatus Amesbacteria bacterium]MBI2587373.1 murein biosynthesis integral membrane protein MurJ [Candidatus Amesbacteria bacterium]
MRHILKNGFSLFLRRQNSILSAAAILILTYGLSHLVGLLKTRLLIAYFFGSSASLLDVYYAAFVIPDTVFQLLIIGSLSAAFIPVFTQLLSRDEKEAWHTASLSLNLVILAFLLLSVFIFIFANPLSHLIAPGFSPSQISIMASLLRVMFAAQLFFAISGFLTGMIQSHQRFLAPALAPVAYNLGIILGIIVLSPTLGILGPALGVVFGAFLHMIIQLPIALRLGFRFSFNLDIGHPPVREIIRLLPPRTLALGIDQIEQFVAVFLTSLLAPGSLSLLNVSRLLYAIPSSLFGVTIAQAALPTLSRQSTQHDLHQFRATLASSFLQVSFLALPLSVLFVVLRIPIVRLVFGSQSFPWAATLLTAKTLAVLAVSAAFAAIIQLVIRGFYALHDTRTPLTIGFFAAVFDTVLSIILVRYFHLGVIGIAAAISTTAIIEALVLSFTLEHRLGAPRPLESALFRSLAKMVLISFVTGISLWLPMRLLDQFVFDTTRTLPLLLLTLTTGSIGLSAYLLLSYLFKVEELASFATLVVRIWSWRKLLISPPEAPSEPVILPAPDQN